jgi:hypothetical protein
MVGYSRLVTKDVGIDTAEPFFFFLFLLFEPHYLDTPYFIIHLSSSTFILKSLIASPRLVCLHEYDLQLLIIEKVEGTQW